MGRQYHRQDHTAGRPAEGVLRQARDVRLVTVATYNMMTLLESNYLQGPYAARGDDGALLTKKASDKSNVDELDALFAAEG